MYLKKLNAKNKRRWNPSKIKKTRVETHPSDCRERAGTAINDKSREVRERYTQITIFAETPYEIEYTDLLHFRERVF